MSDPSTTALRRRGLDRQRQLTVMSVDIVGSTPLAEVLDPERWRDILLTFHDICDQALSRYGGAIAARQGDGLMAHFGLDNPHEDDPRRATLTGLAIQRSLGPLITEVAVVDNQEFAVRVGAHTGPILITEIGGRHEMVGSTANETARLESAATPGTVAVSRTVREHLGDEFEFEPERQVDLRGVSEPMEIFTVKGLAAPKHEPPATPMVGRMAERSELLDIWVGVRDGSDGHRAAMIRGEAGIGKSRLAEFAAGAAAVDGARRLVFETREFDSTLPLHPISAALEYQFGLFELLDESDRHRALLDGLTDVGAEAAVPALAQLVGLSQALLGEAAAADPSAVREMMLHGALGWIGAVVAAGKTVVTFEDLQWADETTLELIGRLLGDLPENLMLVLTCRPGFEAPWPDAPLRMLELGALPQEDVVRLAEYNSGGAPLRDEQVGRLVSACDGNPLYVEQLLARGGGTWLGNGNSVPDSLDHLLTTIIEAPGVDQELLGLLAAIGRRVDLAFVAEVLEEPVAHVADRLGDLCDNGVLEEEAGASRPSFRFHHALVQSAAYEHQLASDRRHAHARIADAIERTAGSVELDHRSVARHLDLAQRHAQAVPRYLAASAASIRRGAVLEAQRLAERGLELLADLPAEQRSNELEIELELQHGLCITSSEGYGSEAAAASAERARALIHEDSRRDLAVRALIDVYSFYMARGRRDDEAEVVEQVRELAAGDDDYRHFVDQLDALHIWHLGQLKAARDLYLSVIELRERNEAAGVSDPVTLPADNLAAAYIQMGPIWWHLGDADAAFEYIDKAHRRAHALVGSKAVFSEAWATSWLGYLQVQSGSFEAALETTTGALEFCNRKGLVMWGGMAFIYQTIARANLEPSDEAEVTLSALIDAVHGMGVTTMTPYFLLQRAKLRAALGRSDDALAGFTDAIETAHRNQEVPEVADGYRLRGVTLASLGRPGEAVDDLMTAARTAAEQGAVIFGIRALSDMIDLIDPSLWPDASIEQDLALRVDGVATPDRYPEVARARALLERTP